ncbi:MAG: DUF4428 domain-containing protein [Flavobacteriales bacterium]
MANCIVCSTELKFMNTMKFNKGKLSDGEDVCTSCFKKINNANPSMAFKLKNYTLSDVQELFTSTYGKLDKIIEQIKALPINNTSVFLGRKEIK